MAPPRSRIDPQPEFEEKEQEPYLSTDDEAGLWYQPPILPLDNQRHRSTHSVSEGDYFPIPLDTMEDEFQEVLDNQFG